MGGLEYPEAVGKTRREAKEEAAKLVFNEIYGSKEVRWVYWFSFQLDYSQSDLKFLLKKMLFPRAEWGYPHQLIKPRCSQSRMCRKTREYWAS